MAAKLTKVVLWVAPRTSVQELFPGHRAQVSGLVERLKAEIEGKEARIICPRDVTFPRLAADQLCREIGGSICFNYMQDRPPALSEFRSISSSVKAYGEEIERWPTLATAEVALIFADGRAVSKLAEYFSNSKKYLPPNPPETGDCWIVEAGQQVKVL